MSSDDDVSWVIPKVIYTFLKDVCLCINFNRPPWEDDANDVDDNNNNKDNDNPGSECVSPHMLEGRLNSL